MKIFPRDYSINERLIKSYLHNYMPRKLILCIDSVLVIIAAYLTFWLISTITGTDFSVFHFNWQLWVIVLMQIGFFLWVRSFAGLIRYSSLNDAWVQFKVVLLNVITLLVVNQIYYELSQHKLIVNAGVIIYGVFGFTFLFLFRVVVKSVYRKIYNNEASTKAFILGTDWKDVAMASSLIEHNSDTFCVSGFVSRSGLNLKKHIFNLPIISMAELQREPGGTAAIIVREDKLKNLRNKETSILSEFLAMNFKIYKFPKLQDWQNFSKTGFNDLKEIKLEDLLGRSPIKLNHQKLFSIYQNKVVLITGAAGSIGSEIVRQIIKFQPREIILVDQAETPLHELCLELDSEYPGVAYKKLIADVRNKARMQQIFEQHRPQIVFHAAAYKHVPMMETNIGEAISVNFQGTRFVSELAVEYGIERFVFISTDKAVNPTNIMGATKRAAEIFIQSLSRQSKVKTTFMTTRFGNVLGSNGSVVPHFKKQIAAGGPVTLTHSEITRYFMTIDEACQLVLEAGGMGNGGEIFVFDMGTPVKILDLAKQMIRLSGLVPDVDIPIEIIGLRPGEKLYEELLADKEKTTKTYHEKILIGEATFQFDETKLNLLNVLLEMSLAYNTSSCFAILQRLVPEYQRDEALVTDKGPEPESHLRVEGF